MRTSLISSLSARWLRWVPALLVLLPAIGFAAGRLVVGLSLEPPNLDPSATSAEATQDVVYTNIFEGLTRIAENGSVQPALADHWTISDDGLHYRFFLRSGIRFHDGAVLTAEDVRWTLDRARKADSINPLHGLLSDIVAIRAVDERTVDIELSRPVADLVTTLAWGNLVIMNARTAAQAKTSPVGTGPFRFTQWRKGDSVVLERNPNYWGTPARLDQVTFRIIPDATSALASLLAGDIDAFPNFPAPESLKQIEKDPRFSVAIGSTEGETLLAINNARAPFNDVRVRRALAHAIDRHAIIEGAMYGYGTPIGSHFSPHDSAYLDLTGQYPHDPARSRQLLRDAGYPNGVSVTLRLPPPYYARRSGEILASQLTNAGFQVRIENIEWAQWLDQVFKRHDFDLTIVSHTEPKDYDIYSRPDYYFGYHSVQYDQRLDVLSRTFDPQRRKALLQDLQRQLADDCVNVWLFELPKFGVWKKHLTGLWTEAPVQGVVLSAVAWDHDVPTAARGSAKGTRALGAVILITLMTSLFVLFRKAGLAYVLQRIQSLLLTLIGASIVVFTLIQILPGDAAAYMLGLNASPEAIHRLQVDFGLDAPLWRQYWTWISRFFMGDFGTSYTYQVPVAELIVERLSLSAPLALLSLLLAAALAIPAALAAAYRPKSITDQVLSALTQIGLAIPNYWLALLLVMLFAVGLQVLPSGGFPGWDSGLLHAGRYLALPALALALPQACVLARILRSELGRVLQEDFIRTARAKGAGPLRVLLKHAFPNALIPTLTIMGLQFSFLIAGAVIVESIFSLPGIGRLLFQATAQRDLMVMRSVVLLLVATVVCVNLIVELLWALVDPRIRQSDPT